MKRLATMLIAGLWLTAVARVQALELGDIEVGSLRGEPLMARIAIVEFAEGGSGNLRVGRKTLPGQESSAMVTCSHSSLKSWPRARSPPTS